VLVPIHLRFFIKDLHEHPPAAINPDSFTYCSTINEENNWYSWLGNCDGLKGIVAISDNDRG
jgi:hypothetical protein